MIRIKEREGKTELPISDSPVLSTPFAFFYPVKRIAIGCDSLDDMLGGGVEKGCVTLFYGEAGAGKTNVCLQLAKSAALQGYKVAYIDTEGVSMERLSQISGDSNQEVMRNTLFFQVHDFEEQAHSVDNAVRLVESNNDVGMIIVDSMTMYYRLGARDDMQNVRKSLIVQTEKLLNVARRMDVPVVLTSQVYTAIDTGTFEFLGGHVLHHNAKTIIRLDKVGPNRRRAVVMKHRSIPEGRSVFFSIGKTGLEG
ncbi:MAG: repair protein RadB [Candidatus Methanomethylophilaceae archaeon]|nr:repair protein RadB [Candidatus Methanomethylophilaceae archaeon]MDI3542346.1 repair protein RadB [Candidatus Methanomethylophilaceae archaeon]